MTSIKRVAYSYNSVLEDQGEDAYFLDAMSFEDGETVVDVSEKFKSKNGFLQRMEELIPMIGEYEGSVSNSSQL